MIYYNQGGFLKLETNIEKTSVPLELFFTFSVPLPPPLERTKILMSPPSFATWAPKFSHFGHWCVLV